MSRSISARSKNRLIVGLGDNFRDGAKERSLSPALGLRPKDAIELSDLNSNYDIDLNDPNDTTSSFTSPQYTGSSGAGPESKSSMSGSVSKSFSATSSRKGKGPKPGSGKRRLNNAYDDEGIEIHSSIDSDFSDTSRASRKSGGSSARSSSLYASDDDLEYFCVDHMQLCSNKVIKKHHDSCTNVVPAFEWAEAQKMERDRKNTEARLTRFDNFAGIMIEERSNMKKQLVESKEVVTEDFLDMMEDLIAHLLSKQKDFMAKLDEIHESNLKKISDQIKRCKMVQKEAGVCLQQLAVSNRTLTVSFQNAVTAAFTSCSYGILEGHRQHIEHAPDSPEYNRLKKKIQEKCPVYEEILRRDFNGALRMDYEFVPDPTVESVFNKFNGLGNVVIRRKPSKLPGFLSNSNEIDFSKRNLINLSRNDGASAADTQPCCFTGCAYITGGRMVLTDWNNSCVKMFNNKGILIHRLNLPNNPWDVRKIDDKTIVVTIPGEQMIVILEYSSSELDLLLTFETGCECWGIVPIGDKFATTCDPWSKSPSIKIFSDKGKLLSFFQKDEQGQMLLQYPEHIATDNNNTTLFISDSRANKVLAVSLEGVVVFRYIHEKLTYPVGLDTDIQGNVYVCGKESKNVHQISKDGEFVRMILDNSELEAPRALCFEPVGELLMVTETSSDGCDEFLTTQFS